MGWFGLEGQGYLWGCQGLPLRPPRGRRFSRSRQEPFVSMKSLLISILQQFVRRVGLREAAMIQSPAPLQAGC